MLKTIWANIEYYTKISGQHKRDVYRADRFGKSMELTTLFDIAERLNVPAVFLLEDDNEITLEVAYAMVCKNLGITQRELEQTLSFKREIKRVIKKFE